MLWLAKKRKNLFYLLSKTNKFVMLTYSITGEFVSFRSKQHYLQTLVSLHSFCLRTKNLPKEIKIKKENYSLPRLFLVRVSYSGSNRKKFACKKRIGSSKNLLLFRSRLFAKRISKEYNEYKESEISSYIHYNKRITI